MITASPAGGAVVQLGGTDGGPAFSNICLYWEFYGTGAPV